MAMLATIGLRPARGGEPAEVAPIAQRIRDLAEHATLSLKFQGSTAAECRAWQDRFGAKLGALLGPHKAPERWASTLERTVELVDHVREERVMSAEGVAPLPVHLLLPRGRREKRPGIVALHGHGHFGHDSVVGRDDSPERRKEIAENHYDYGRELVRRGYVVAAPCLTPFGRRRGIAEPRADACAQTFIGLQALGRLLIAENLRDVLWAVEALAGHPEVDADRLGCVGLSYGGRMTMFAAAVEPRIKVAVISGALNCLQERVANGFGSGCQTVPGLLTYGDVPEIAGLIAPRPCLWEIGSRDTLISPDWASAALTRIGRAYTALGVGDRLKVDRFEGGHQWHGIEADKLIAETLGNRS
jgi:dienelactone hydrolase